MAAATAGPVMTHIVPAAIPPPMVAPMAASPEEIPAAPSPETPSALTAAMPPADPARAPADEPMRQARWHRSDGPASRVRHLHRAHGHHHAEGRMEREPGPHHISAEPGPRTRGTGSAHPGHARHHYRGQPGRADRRYPPAGT